MTTVCAFGNNKSVADELREQVQSVLDVNEERVELFVLVAEHLSNYKEQYRLDMVSMREEREMLTMRGTQELPVPYA